MMIYHNLVINIWVQYSLPLSGLKIRILLHKKMQFNSIELMRRESKYSSHRWHEM